MYILPFLSAASMMRNGLVAVDGVNDGWLGFTLVFVGRIPRSFTSALVVVVVQ
jgi:predicted DNA-binding transcriptional regulator